mmetsp:Transcript_11702/g.13246  ORF Transcript_11702/g.13246 Transcript_11702/m.13246 type:complete len:177 (+) Transcript_11702:30-560(+)
MGIDLKAGGRTPNKNKKDTKSTNLYLHLLIRLYRFLNRRTESKFNRVILKRLVQSRLAKAPMSISRVAKNVEGKEGKVAVLVGTVTNDDRLFTVPALKICALRFTETARARIVKAGGECITFDELALLAPTGANTILLRGPKRREAHKFMGKGAGISGSKTHIKKQSSKSSEAKRK